jgi:hypothetical protein
MSEQRANNPSTPNKSPRTRKRSTVKATSRQPEAAPVASDSTPAPAAAIVLSLSTVDRELMIRTAAYYRAERRNFASGHALEDWLAAESEIDAALLGGSPSS